MLIKTEIHIALLQTLDKKGVISFVLKQSFYQHKHFLFDWKQYWQRGYEQNYIAKKIIRKNRLILCVWDFV
jgi:hypothetical protein